LGALLAAGLSLAAALASLLLDDGGTAHSRPSAAEESVAREQRIAFFEARAAADPIDFLSLNNLAAEYLQRARETGDVADYARAEQAATRSLELIPGDNYAGLTLLASVRLVQHDFAAVEALANQAMPLKPLGPTAYGLLGDAQIGLGRYGEAFENYDKMRALDAGLPALSRLANHAFITGDRFDSIDLWKQAVAQSQGLPVENQAWAHVQLGVTYFAYGDYTTAAKEHQLALDLFPDYVHALAGLAQTRAAQERYDESIDLYTRAVARLPQPQYVAALGDVLTAAGRDAEAEQPYALVEAIASLYEANSINTDLQIALFYADHDRNLNDALAMAEAAYEAGPGVYAADALAWALYKNGRYDEAAAKSDIALAEGTPEASFLFHAALIHLALGDEAAARNHLSQAVELNPRFSPLHAEDAQRLLANLEANR
jgi:tetratricopeptide (TPR) repeat protein